LSFAFFIFLLFFFFGEENILLRKTQCPYDYCVNNRFGNLF